MRGRNGESAWKLVATIPVYTEWKKNSKNRGSVSNEEEGEKQSLIITHQLRVHTGAHTHTHSQARIQAHTLTQACTHTK